MGDDVERRGRRKGQIDVYHDASFLASSLTLPSTVTRLAFYATGCKNAGVP
jgi:hypothetical protein